MVEVVNCLFLLYYKSMKNSEENLDIYWLLMKVMFQAKHEITAVADELGLTLMQASALSVLNMDEPLPMNTLSNLFKCDASNVTGIIDRLEKHDLIRRQDHPTDRRVKMIALTPAGNKTRDTILHRTVELEAKRLSPVLTAEDQANLRTILQKITAAKV